MNATIKLEQEKHYPVLLDEILSIITPQYSGTLIDCTFGLGGYSKKILKIPNSKIIAIDRDKEVEKFSEELKEKYKDRFKFENIKFSQVDSLQANNQDIKYVIFDLGYSYYQIKDLKKGLSFNSKGRLNMKMGFNNFSASDAVNKLEKKELEKIFRVFGEEKNSSKIAFNIIKAREKKEINTEELVKIIKNSKSKKYSKIHKATKVFQALRIFVNQEISELVYGLINATKILKPGGILIVVTFHSLEDKIVKFFFKNFSEQKSVSRYLPKEADKRLLFKKYNKKPIIPGIKEIQKNPSSRSAKLRYVVKKENINNFKDEFLKEFQNLIDIENLGKKL